jgi:hypothetical protein
MIDHPLTALALRVRDSVLRAHEDWADHVSVLPGGNIQIAVPAPRGSRAGHLVIFTARGEETWIRYSPARACYLPETDRELHAVIDALLADRAFLVVVTDGDDWLETSLLRPGEEVVLGEGQVANVFSWSGHHDKIVTYTEKSPRRGS